MAPAARAETRLVEAIVYYLGVATSAGAVWGKSLKSPFKYHHCCCVMLLRILKMDQIDLFVGGRPWLALASGYLEQKDCLYIGSAKFCPGGHFGDNFHATSAGARKIKEEHHVTDGTWSNLGIAAVPGLRPKGHQNATGCFNPQTRYTLDRRPWHEMGFSAKNSMFFDVPHFALFQTTAKQHFIAFFSSLFQKLFQLF